MRCVLQRVAAATVSVEGELISQIGPGVLCLVGITRDDKKEDSDWIVRKILGMKLWPDSSGKPWKKSVSALDREVLLVSQFTLHAVYKGNKPDYHNSMDAGEASMMFDGLVSDVRKSYRDDRVQEGDFGAMMEVSLVNDGPVTLWLDSRDRTNKNAIELGRAVAAAADGAGGAGGPAAGSDGAGGSAAATTAAAAKPKDGATASTESGTPGAATAEASKGAASREEGGDAPVAPAPEGS